MKNIFKRSTAWMLSLALLLGLFAGVPGAVLSKVSAAETDATVEVNNLLAGNNPYFEEYAIPNWTITEGVAQSSEQAKGNWSLKINVKDASATSEAVNAVAGYTYNASVSVLGAGKLAVVFYDAEGNVIAEEAAEANNEAWATLTVAANAPAGTVKAAVKLSAATDAAVYFDDAAIAMGDMWVSTNLLNGSMDEWNTKQTKPLNWNNSGNGYAQPTLEAVEGRGNVVTLNREGNKVNFYSDKFDVVGGMAYIITLDVYQSVALDYQIYMRVYDAEGTRLVPPPTGTAPDLSQGTVPAFSQPATYEQLGDNATVGEWTTVAFSLIVPTSAVKADILITAPWNATGVLKLDNATASVANDVYDPSFENAPNNIGMPGGHVGQSVNASKRAEYISTAVAKDGEQSIATVTKTWLYSNYINVIPGETYTATIQITTDEAHLAGWNDGGLINYYVYYYDAAHTQLSAKQASAVPVAGEWTEISVSSKAPEGAVAAKLMFYSTKGALAYVDCQTFAKTSDVFGETSIANADFEKMEKVITSPSVGGGNSYIAKWLLSSSNNNHNVVYTDAVHGYSANMKSGMNLWSDFIPVTAGETYRFSIEMKGEGRLQAIVYYYTADATSRTEKMVKEDGKTPYGKTITPDLTGEWTPYTHETVAPAGATKALVWLVCLDSSDKTISGNAYFDNVSFTQACEHDFTGEAVVTEATCGADGSSVVTCPDCGATQTTVIPATGEHTLGEGVVTAPTCTDKGYTTYICSVCGETVIKDETPVADHSWNEGVYTNPTTEADGYTTFTCTVCGNTKVETDEGSKLVSTAQIIRNGEVVGTYFTVAEALTNLQEGDTIKLIADTSEGFNLPATGVNDITFDGNGFTVYGVVRIQHTAESASGLTITNTVFSGGYVVISVGYHENVTIQDCIFENGAYISTYNTTGVKNLTLTGNTFDGVSNANGTASAVILKNVENLTVTGNEILSVEWNAFQIGSSTGNMIFQNNNIVWDTARADVDGAYNLHTLENAKILLSGNTYEIGANNADKNIVNVQIAATNVALFCYDDVKVNGELFSFNEGNVYCTGHIDENADSTCDLCNTSTGPIADSALKFMQAPSLSFQDYIGMQVLMTKKLANKYDKVYVEAVQVTPEGEVTTTLEPITYLTNYYVFDQQIMAWSMTETVTLTLYAEKDGKTYVGQTYTQSVESLALAMMQKYSTNTTICRMLVDMLNYGAAVQTQFSHNAENLPNTQLGDFAAMGSTNIPECDATNTKTGTATVKVINDSVSMQAKVEIQLVIKGAVTATPKATIGTTVLNPVLDTTSIKGYTVIRVAVGATQLRETVTIALYDANDKPVTQVYNVSVEGYAVTAITGSQKDVVIAMMRYGDSVTAYANK